MANIKRPMHAGAAWKKLEKASYVSSIDETIPPNTSQGQDMQSLWHSKLMVLKTKNWCWPNGEMQQ